MNVFNQVNFDPEAGTNNSGFETDLNDYETNGTLGQNGARVLQLIGRFNW